MKVVLLNLIFYPTFFLFSAVAIPALSLIGVIVRCFRSHRQTMAFFRRAIGWYGKVVVRVFPFPFVQVSHVDDEPGRPKEPFIGVCNHQSASDPFLMSCLKGEFVQIVNVWPFRLPVLGIYAKWAGYLSVNEIEPDEFIERVSVLLASGVSVLAYPEGTRSRTGKVGSFHSIMFRVAIKNQCPIVPISISGNERTPTPGSGVLHPARIVVRKLPALEWESFGNMTPFKLKNSVRQMLIEAVEKHQLEGQKA